MRRIVLLGPVTPIVALGLLALTEAALFAQAPKPESSKAPAVTAPAGTFHPGTFSGVELRASDVSAPALDANPLRQRFIELSKKKANALSEEQLKGEVERLEAQVRELEAWAKAQEAVRLLHEVIEKHPNTKAAEAANEAIQFLEGRQSGLIRIREKEKQFRRAPELFEDGPHNLEPPSARPTS